jgi:hypothetical protein
MPYLPVQRKKYLDDGEPVVSAGDLTYMFSKALIQYEDDLRQIRWRKVVLADEIGCEKTFTNSVEGAIQNYLPSEPRYENYCIIVGAFECALREHQRRLGARASELVVGAAKRFQRRYYASVVGPYENKAIKRNGDLDGYDY